MEKCWDEWKKLTYQRPRKKVSSVRTLGGCGHQRGRWPLCCGTSEYRTSVPSTGCRSCNGPENMTHMIRTTKFVQVGTNVSGRESLTKRSWTQPISESQSRQWTRNGHLVFLLQQVADVLQFVSVHWLEVLWGVTHCDDSVGDIGEVQVVAILNESPFLLWHKCLDRVGHCHPPHHSHLDSIREISNCVMEIDQIYNCWWQT